MQYRIIAVVAVLLLIQMRHSQERVASAFLAEAPARAQAPARSEPSKGRIFSTAAAQVLTAPPRIAVAFQNTAGQTSTQNRRSQANNLVQASPSSTHPEFGGTYEALNPQQKKLMDEWYADYNKLTGDHACPTEYNQYSLSTRTT